MDIFAKTFKKALSQADNTELQLKLQAAQHAHELKMMKMFTQFLAGRQPNQPHPFARAPGGSSYYPDQVNPPTFGQDYSPPGPFTQDNTRPNFTQNDGHPCPPFYQDYVSAGRFHYSYPPVFSIDRTPLLPPNTPPPETFTSLHPLNRATLALSQSDSPSQIQTSQSYNFHHPLEDD